MPASQSAHCFILYVPPWKHSSYTNVHSLSKHISKNSHHKEKSHLWRQSGITRSFTPLSSTFLNLCASCFSCCMNIQERYIHPRPNRIQTLTQVSDADSVNLTSTILQENKCVCFHQFFSDRSHVFLNHATRRKRTMPGNFILPNAN
jgi:hypothetical protein